MIGAVIVTIYMALFGNIGSIIKDIGKAALAPVVGLVKGVNDISRGQANISQAVSPIQPVVTSFPTTGSGFQRTIPASTFQRTQPGFDLQKTIKGTDIQPAAPPGTPFVPTPTPTPTQTTGGGSPYIFEPYNVPEIPVKLTGDSGLGGASSQQGFGGGTGVSDTTGGAGLIPGSLTSSFRQAGTGGLINLLTEEEKKRGVLIKFAGSPDLFDPNEGMYVSKEAVNEQFKVTGRPIEFIETDVLRPGITSEADFGRLSQEVNGVRTVQNLSAAELSQITAPIELPPTSAIVPKDTETGLKDLRDQIFKMVESGTDNLKDFQTKLKESSDFEASSKKQLKDLELLTSIEIDDILHQHIPKILAQRRVNSLVAPYTTRWFERQALTNQLEAATFSKKTLLDSFELTRTLSQDKFNNAIKVLDTFKISNIQYQTVGDTVYSVYLDPATNEIRKQAIFKDPSLDKSRGIKDVKVYDDGQGQTYREVVYNDGISSGPMKLGSIKKVEGDISSSALINNIALALPSEPARQFFLKSIAGQKPGTDAYKTAVTSAIISGFDVTTQNNIRGRFQVLRTLDKLEAAMNEGMFSTNILKGNLEKGYNAAGATTNPKLASWLNRVNAAVFAYTKSVSGAQFSVEEQKRYFSLFPKSTSGKELNTAKITSLRESFVDFNKVDFGSVIGEADYDSIYGKGGVAGQTTNQPSGNNPLGI